MKRRLLCISTTFILLLPIQFASASVAGTPCRKLNTIQKIGALNYRCALIKGKQIWFVNNETGHNSEFYSIHKTNSGNTYTVQKITVNRNMVVQNILPITSGGYTLEILDHRNGVMLLESSDLYYLADGKTPEKLDLTSSNMSGNFLHAKLSSKKNNFYISTDSSNIYSSNFDQPSNTILAISGLSLNDALNSYGFDTTNDWITDFYAPSTTEMYIETVNNQNHLVRLWHVTFVPGVGTVTQGKLVTSLSGPPNVIELADMSVSPSGNLIALMAGTSQLTPIDTLQIIQTDSDIVRTVDPSRYYSGQNFSLAWLNERQLISTKDYVWKQDKDGGRVIYRINLFGPSSVTEVPFVPGVNLFTSN